MDKWQDTTSYSPGDKERIPTSFTLKGKGVRITVVNSHIYYPGKWVTHCSSLGIDTHLLDATDLESAKEEALKLAHMKAVELLNAINDLMR